MVVCVFICVALSRCFWFPIFSEKACDELVEEMEQYMASGLVGNIMGATILH